jgi:hypothetical protein
MLMKNKVICALALVSALACGLAPVKIADIKRNPDRFENRAVTVHGKATGVTKLPFMTESFYEIDDGTGTIVVVSRNALPPEGKKVFVRGKVKSAFKIGGQSYGLAILEDH